jgi:hypothetical protein
MLEGSEREHSRAAERSLIIECTIAIEPSADFDSPKIPNQALQRMPRARCTLSVRSNAQSLAFFRGVAEL